MSGGRVAMWFPAEALTRAYLGEGQSLQQIADEHGTTATTIRNKLLALGVPLRSRGGTRRGKKNPYVRVSQVELTRLYAEGLSTWQIAQRLGSSQSTIARRLRAGGVTLRKSGWHWPGGA